MKWGRPRIETARVGDYAFDFFDFFGASLRRARLMPR